MSRESARTVNAKQRLWKIRDGPSPTGDRALGETSPTTLENKGSATGQKWTRIYPIPEVLHKARILTANHPATDRADSGVITKH